MLITAQTRTNVHVRPFDHRDLSAVVETRRRLFPIKHPTPFESHVALFRRVFLENPWCDGDVPSLVCEDHQGRLVGFLGVIARPFQMKGQRYVAANGQLYMVDPASRGTSAAVELLKALFAGKQDLTFTGYAGVPARKIWTVLGGSTSFLHSIDWVRPLRPVTFAARALSERIGYDSLGRGVAPLGRFADILISRGPGRRFHRVPVDTTEESVGATDLIAAATRLFGRQLLRPVYDETSLGWLLTLFEEQRALGTLHKVIVRSDDGTLLGYFIYYLNPGGQSDVVQIGATEDTIETVLRHLLHHAWKGGSYAIGGRLDPRFMRPFMLCGVDFLPGQSWMLTHARSPEVRLAFQEGQCAISKIECDLTFL